MITDFLQTKTTKADLGVALRVLQEFKGCESESEWLHIPFAAWTKLEQLEEFLVHMVDGKPLKVDTIRYMDTVGRQDG